MTDQKSALQPQECNCPFWPGPHMAVDCLPERNKAWDFVNGKGEHFERNHRAAFVRGYMWGHKYRLGFAIGFVTAMFCDAKWGLT